MHKTVNAAIEQKSLTYESFLEAWAKKVGTTDPEQLDDKEKQNHEYRKINLQRTKRIEKTYKPGEDEKEFIEAINGEHLWLVITEDWCGDSAQTIPYIVKLAGLNEHITVRVLERDTSPEVMELYLTNGNKAIPKVVVFNNGEELFSWGPRPAEAQALVNQWKAEGFSKDEFNMKLHAWYPRDRGKATLDDFLTKLQSALPGK